jgi:hypothetical protein
LVDFLKAVPTLEQWILEWRELFGMVIGKLFGHTNTQDVGKIYQVKK